MAVLHLPQLGHRAVDAIEARLQQQAQGPGAAAFLKGIPPALQTRDLPFQTGLLLFQPAAGALLDGQGVGGLLELLFAVSNGLKQGLPGLLQGCELLLHGVSVGTVLLLLLGELLQSFPFLPQPFLQLLLLLQQGSDVALQLLTAATAALLFFNPGTGSTRHIRQPSAGHLHRRFSGFAVVFGGAQGVLMGIAFQLP